MLSRTSALTCLAGASAAVTKAHPPLRRLLHSSHLHTTPTRRASVAVEREGLRLTFPSGSDQLFPYAWLRDSDPALIHPLTRQKVHSTVDIPAASKPADVQVSDDSTELVIHWDTVASGAQPSKIPLPPSTTFPLSFLERQASTLSVRTYHHDISPTPWSRSTLSRAPDLRLPYDSLMSSDDTLLRAVSQLSTSGILFISDVPTTHTSDARAAVSGLAQRIGTIRETFYGRFWDVQSRGTDSRNVAYTDLDLGLHIDLQYFENPPRYQILHMLRCRGVIGGESIFSDAFHAAHELARRDREAFDCLATEPVAFHYENDGHHLYREHPTIELAPPGSHFYRPPSNDPHDVPAIQYINYSPPFQAPLPLRTASNPKFLPALRSFAQLLTSPEALFEYKMEEGDAVVFDNRRVLHGRREFRNTSTKKWDEVRKRDDTDEEGVRWIKGCYIEPEDILDRLSVLKDRQLADQGR